MVVIVAWCLFALAVAHIVFGLSRFRQPLAQAVAAGFIGQFAATPERRTAFWFMIFALPMMLAGQVAAHASHNGDLALLRLVGWYLLAIAVIGVAAFPKSPFWGALLLAPVLLAAGHGWV
jgi:hypothetical protein